MTQPIEPLSASLEDYIEAILHIEAAKHAARAKDIADRLQVSSASVTGALRQLAEKELINYAPYDIITLTTKGRDIAQDVVNRHEMLRNFFVNVLGIESIEAETAACKMEHGISPTILDRMTRFVEFLAACPRGKYTWNEDVNAFCPHGITPLDCETCLQQALQGDTTKRGTL